MSASVTLFSGFMLAAAVWDLRTRRIPNGLNLAAAACGVLFAYMDSGWPGVGWSLAAFFIPLLTLLPLAVLTGWIGGGDAKLLAAVGAWLGPVGLIGAAALGAVIGGVLAVFYLLVRATKAGMLRDLLMYPLTAMTALWVAYRKDRLAYGPALAAGAIVWVLVGGEILADSFVATF